MSPYRRNIMVGIVVLGAMGVLGWMLIQFGGRMMGPFAPPTIHVRVIADRADGLSNGSAVLYRGVNAGRVEKVSRSPDQLQVYIDTAVDKSPPLPANVRAEIRTQVVGGGATVSLETPQDIAPQGALQENQIIQGHFLGMDLIPPEITALATELRETARQFRESKVVEHLDDQITNAGKLVDSIRSFTDDKAMREDLKQSLENIRTVTDKADKIAGNLQQLSSDLDGLSKNASAAMSDARVTLGKTQAEILSISRQMSEGLQQTSKLLDQFQQITEKINKGQGTAGAMVNDPRLYEALVDTTRQLNATVGDLRRLIDQWEQEGVSLKVK